MPLPHARLGCSAKAAPAGVLVALRAIGADLLPGIGAGRLRATGADRLPAIGAGRRPVIGADLLPVTSIIPAALPRQGSPADQTGRGSACSVGRRPGALGLGWTAAAAMGRTAASGVGSASTAVNYWGFQRATDVGSGLQPVGLLLLRDLDSASDL